MTPRMKKIRAIYGGEPASASEVFDCVLAVLQHYAAQDNHRVVGLKWDLCHSNEVSNTHSKPHNGVENWGGKQGLPMGYPGWTGRVWVRYSGDGDRYRGSDLFAQTMTHTGTGGYGSYNGPWEWIYKLKHKMATRLGISYHDIKYDTHCYSWDYRFYDADWPRMNDGFAFDLLATNTFPRINHIWECNEQKLLDQKWSQELEDLVYE